MAITHALHDIVDDMRGEVHDLTTITAQDAPRQSYLALWVASAVVPMLFGLDKLFNFMHAGWTNFFASWVYNILPGTHTDAVHTLGVVEIVLAVLVLTMPRIGGDLLALYFFLAAISILGVGGMPVYATGAFAFTVGALAMARLSTTYHRR